MNALDDLLGNVASRQDDHNWIYGVDEARAELAALREENARLRADHKEMVARNKVLRDRLDLDAEKVHPRLAILSELDRLRAKVEKAEELEDAARNFYAMVYTMVVDESPELVKENINAERLIDALAAYRSAP